MADHQVWLDRDGAPFLESLALGDDVVVVRLVGEDGNVFSIIGRVVGALRDAGRDQEAAAFRDQAFASGSYDEVLALVLEFCEVE